MNDSGTIHFPEMAFVKQSLAQSRLTETSEAVRSALEKLALPESVISGQTVAVAVGSRGINQIDRVVYHCIEFLKKKGLKPFILPGMGSHGGATADGQKEVLSRLGITDGSMGIRIEPEMAVSCIDELPNGTKIFIAKQALSADHIVVINRIKHHTKFRAEIESGLCKMLTIGLGKAEGAAEYHRQAITHSFRIIEDAARVVLNRLPVLFGLGLLEDGFGQLARAEAMLPSDLIGREKTLLKEADAMMGRIPFDHLDILVIDYFGKDISGIGMDSNVTGRHRDLVGDFVTAPHVKRIFVRDFSPGSDGNGNGIGLSDATTDRFVNALNIEKTYANAITAISMEKAAIPMHFPNDRLALDACVRASGHNSGENVRMVRIIDTARLGCIQISKALEKDLLTNTTLNRLTPWLPFEFNENSNLIPFPLSIET